MSDHPASSGVSASSSLASSLVEDRHQGVTSRAAQATIDRYRAFVQAKKAPIADMKYSPFTKQPTDNGRSSVVEAPKDTNSLVEPALPATAELVSAVVPSVRQWSPRRVSQSNQLEPSILHNKVGGTAWNLDMPGWVKTSGGSKRGSRTGPSSTAGSRKSSFTFTNEKQLHTHLLQPHQRFESSQSIWNATTHHGHAAESHRGSFSHRSLEQQEASDHRLSEPAKRTSLNLGSTMGGGFLKAHSAEEKFGVTLHSRPIRVATHTNALLTAQGKRMKRASMPPLQNRRGLLEASTSRRSSLSMAQPNRSVHNQALRNRSQSLPTDSLFLAYSSCALPTVMTSSLAAMPIPSQPAIPVSVARRYSILSGEVKPSMAHATEESVNVDPSHVDGIDTSSTLDTSFLRNIASDADDVDELEMAQAHANKSRLASTYSTPAGSPTAADGHQEVRMDAFPLSMMSPVPEMAESSGSPTMVQMDTSSPPSSSSIPASSSTVVGGRSRSLIHTKQTNGLTIAAPSRDQLATPDYTPMTSPTNLSNPIFKHTMISRRMSEVVARDIAVKLRTLKAHMEQRRHDDSEEEEAEEMQ